MGIDFTNTNIFFREIALDWRHISEIYNQFEITEPGLSMYNYVNISKYINF